ncbi:hypothetical protein RIF29_41383 [Crotalaria pallida]|uniref:Reverse transcriptase zinc-binding domain-containing protein n=1 Tax=Crotalaria pallida TaxID=3830 RepID=A0AAN9E4Y7_CROPI
MFMGWVYYKSMNIGERLLRSHPVPLSPVFDDSVVWLGNSDGSYTVSSAYRWLGVTVKNWHSNPDSASWVWKVKIPAKIQFFAWLVMLSALPTNELRCNRGLAASAACSRCSCTSESVSHVLRDCPHAHEVWFRIGVHAYPNFWTDPCHIWFKSMLRSQMSYLFAAGVWWIWRWRNNHLFDEKKWCIRTVLRCILTDADSFRSCGSTRNEVFDQGAIPRLDRDALLIAHNKNFQQHLEWDNISIL